MAYNTKAIKKDIDGKPIPQVFNPTLDEYEALKGDAGAARHVIYGPDGNPLSIVDNKLAVRASELETLLSALAGKDFATQTTVAAILAKMIAAPATEAKQDVLAGLVGAAADAAITDPATAATMIALLKGLIKQLQGTGTGAVPAQLTGSIAEKASAQDTQVVTTVKAYARAAGASQIEVYVESGSVRVRTDGQACTATTGEPLSAGFYSKWNVATLSVYYAANSTVTVVSR